MSLKSPRKFLKETATESPFDGIPTDVKFQIKGCGENWEENLGHKEEALEGEVPAHKVILGAFSPVFKKGFFGPAKECNDIVQVKETTLESFKVMIDYIYNREIGWDIMTVSELYDVVNLAEKYDIEGLMEEVQDKIENAPLSMDCLMDVASSATQFGQFPPVSGPLLLRCAKFLKENLSTTGKILKFAANQSESGREVTIVKLLSLMDIQDCSNCKQEECQNGKVLASSAKLIGSKIVVNKSCTYWGTSECSYPSYIHSTFTVVGVNFNPGSKVVTVLNDQGKTLNFQIQYYNSLKSVPMFVYKCD